METAREIPGLWQAAAGALGALHSGAFGEFALLSMVLPSSAGEQLLLPRTQLAPGIVCMETKGADLPLHPYSCFPNGIHFTAFPGVSFPKAGSAPLAAPSPESVPRWFPSPKVFPRLLQPLRYLLECCALPSRNPGQPHSIILLPPGNHCA